MKKILFAVICSTSIVSHARGFDKCPQFFFNGTPPKVAADTANKELCFEAFAVLHSGTRKTPVFVAQRLSKTSIDDASDEVRTNKFYTELRLPSSDRSTLNDYKGSGYSRGHMAPAGDMPTPSAMAQSFSLANMVPQNQIHNGGAWSKVEKDTRLYASRAVGDIYVITGPIYVDPVSTVGSKRVAVPTYVFKLVYDPSTKKAWAHIHENNQTQRGIPPYTYKELVQRLKIDLLPTAEIR